MYALELSDANICTKFQANIFIFDCTVAEKTGNGDGVTFFKRDFRYL